MHLGIYSYLISVIVVSLGAGLLFLGAKYGFFRRILKFLPADIKSIVFVVVIFTVFFTPLEHFALVSRAWVYNPDRTFYSIFLGAEVETYIFSFFVSFLVSLATLSFAKVYDKK